MNDYITPFDFLGILFVLNIISLMCCACIKSGIDHERKLRIGSMWINNHEELDNPWQAVPYFKVTAIRKNAKGKVWVKGYVVNGYDPYNTKYISKDQLLDHYDIYKPKA